MGRATQIAFERTQLERTHLDLGGGEQIPLRREVNPRARRILLRIDPTRREAVLIAPRPKDMPRAMAFAAERAVWLSMQLSRLPTRQPLTPDAEIPLRGVMTRLVHLEGRAAPHLVAGSPAELRSGAADPLLFEARVLRFLKATARADLIARVDQHTAKLGVTYQRLTVKDTTSRWGSCSSTGALSFSWRVVMAPPAVLDYLAAHEVAHLVEMNHSHRFWVLVERLCPDHLVLRAWLKSHGTKLHLIG